jgi:hypothetical protein
MREPVSVAIDGAKGEITIGFAFVETGAAVATANPPKQGAA